MHNRFLILSIFYLLMVSEATVAQNTSKPAKSAPTTTNKKLIVKTWLGRATGNIVINAEEARQLITMPLKITGEKNVDYLISSYQLAYKRIGVTEDEETGKTSAESDMAAQRFTTTPLPPVWQKNIIEGLHSGEELYYYDIIVFDKQGRRFFAPDLKISIQ
ncbi:MAG: hypothetical protein ABIS01_15905 [Ferruginibacter sp.]